MKWILWVMALVITASLTSTALAADKATGQDWPQWRGPQRNGLSTETDWSTRWPAEGPRQLWKINVGKGYSAVSVVGNRLYTAGAAGNTETIYCLDADSGTEIWKHAYPCKGQKNYPGTRATPTVADGKVYTFSPQGQLHCLDAAGGKVIWVKDLVQELEYKESVPNWGLASSPLIEGKLVIINVGLAGVAVDKEKGHVVWKTALGKCGYASPVAYTQGGTRCLAMFSSKTLVGVNAADGTRLWSIPWATEYDVNAADPLVVGDQVFACSGYKKRSALLKMDGHEPSIVWDNKQLGSMFSTPVLIDGHLYGCNGNASNAGDPIQCVEWSSGTVKWSQKGYGMSSMIAAGGKLIIMGERGELGVAEASPEGFKELARAKVLDGVCWTMPVLSHGRIYCRNSNGDLDCLDVRK